MSGGHEDRGGEEGNERGCGHRGPAEPAGVEAGHPSPYDVAETDPGREAEAEKEVEPAERTIAIPARASDPQAPEWAEASASSAVPTR